MPEISGEDRDEINGFWLRLTQKYATKNNDGEWGEIGKQFTRAAEEFDLEKLRVYENLLGEGVRPHALAVINSVLLMLRNAGQASLDSLLTKEHMDALMSVENEIPKYSVSIMTYSPFSQRHEALYLLAIKNVHRCSELIKLMRERRTVDAATLGSVLEEMDRNHSALGGGAL